MPPQLTGLPNSTFETLSAHLRSRSLGDEEAHLLRSLRDEREFVLMPRLKRLEDALLLISALSADPTSARKVAHLLEIHQVAEEALTL